MGWRQRKDSNSGHAFFFGVRTKKVLTYCLLSRKCAFCTHYCKKNNLDIHKIDREMMIPDHACVHNHDGSAKSMEGKAAATMLTCVCNYSKVTGIVMSIEYLL